MFLIARTLLGHIHQSCAKGSKTFIWLLRVVLWALLGKRVRITGDVLLSLILQRSDLAKNYFQTLAIAS